MFEKILFPTDFSDVASKALQYVKQLRHAGAREVIVLHVVEQANLDMLSVYSSIEDYLNIEKEVLSRAEEDTGLVANELRQLGLAVTERVVKGSPVRMVLKIAEEEHPSLIVMGSHGRSNLEEILMGSVSEKVVRKATQPVLVIKR
jgi:nucleotide-binding universal stress UspA family protein